MAKSKRKRPRRQAPAGSVHQPHASDPKRERREEAKREREAARRRFERRRSARRLAYLVVVIAVIGGIVVFTTRPKGAALTQEERDLLARATTAASTAGCGPVQTIAPYSGGIDRAHIGQSGVTTAPPLSGYPSTPPASGPHDSSPLSAGVYSTAPPVYQAIHSLEHGAAIVWYSPPASGAELDRIKTFFAQSSHRDHVIVAPFDYSTDGTAGQLPQGRQIALASWHHLQLCATASLAVAWDFVAHYRYPAPKGLDYKGDAPEKGAAI